jgi:hypothetical protein
MESHSKVTAQANLKGWDVAQTPSQVFVVDCSQIPFGHQSIVSCKDPIRRPRCDQQLICNGQRCSPARPR